MGSGHSGVLGVSVIQDVEKGNRHAPASATVLLHLITVVENVKERGGKRKNASLVHATVSLYNRITLM